jgi:hypothetical protein
MLARKQELNTQLQQLIDAVSLAVALWVAYAALCHDLVPSRKYGRSIPELSMAFRGHHAFRANHAGFTGLQSIAPE